MVFILNILPPLVIKTLPTTIFHHPQPPPPPTTTTTSTTHNHHHHPPPPPPPPPIDYGFNGSFLLLSTKGLTLDSQRNHLDFSKNFLNHNQELLDSRYVVVEHENDHGFRIGFHGFHPNPAPGHRLFHDGVVVAVAQKKGSNSTSSPEDEYAPAEKMGEKNYQNQQQQQQLHRQRRPATGLSRLGVSNDHGGEIVEVHGGHIVRSTGRKDRHSKVCTAIGPRDRRVRLSAHTAIQFYDVQDRLGYDRPSKAVDWLIKKAKSAIDELAELPAWEPTTTSATTTGPNSTSILDFDQNPDRENPNNQMGITLNSSFLPPSLASDSIADTIKSFFPMGGSSTPPNGNSPAMLFNRSFPPPDSLSRASNHSQDLKLSLQSFKDPIFRQQNEQGNDMFSDGSGWPERMVGWGGGGSGDTVSGGGFVFCSPLAQTPMTPFLQTLFGQTTNNQLFNNNSQRRPLQSSYSPSIRAWIDQPPYGGGAAVDQQHSVARFTSDFVGGFPGFLIPTRIRGEQEENDADKPSSASSLISDFKAGIDEM
ncbi:hypothetical protein L6452_28555 [Arctium lappa]|uniref:Uncharacterized protein n=1 Tax=Arctium lappa TaxID=4217 RepID=A0ACB8ZZ07_ARCLA|nr:hypothetical protein L6452_28555 [Arctium lappa]